MICDKNIRILEWFELQNIMRNEEHLYKYGNKS